MKKLIIIGTGGMGRETAWLADRINLKEKTYDEISFMDDNKEILGKEINGHKVIGTTDDVEKYPDYYYVCAIGLPRIREQVIKKIKGKLKDIKFETLIDPTAQLSPYIEIGEGSIICSGCLLTVNIKIGEHVILNNNCTVGHDAVIKDYTILYPAVNLSGNTTTGRGCEMGTGMQVIQGKTVGDNVILGAGAVVVRDIEDNCTAVGCPAKPIKFH